MSKAFGGRHGSDVFHFHMLAFCFFFLGRSKRVASGPQSKESWGDSEEEKGTRGEKRVEIGAFFPFPVSTWNRIEMDLVLTCMQSTLGFFFGHIWGICTGRAGVSRPMGFKEFGKRMSKTWILC